MDGHGYGAANGKLLSQKKYARFNDNAYIKAAREFDSDAAFEIYDAVPTEQLQKLLDLSDGNESGLKPGTARAKIPADMWELVFNMADMYPPGIIDMQDAFSCVEWPHLLEMIGMWYNMGNEFDEKGYVSFLNGTKYAWDPANIGTSKSWIDALDASPIPPKFYLLTMTRIAEHAFSRRGVYSDKEARSACMPLNTPAIGSLMKKFRDYIVTLDDLTPDSSPFYDTPLSETLTLARVEFGDTFIQDVRHAFEALRDLPIHIGRVHRHLTHPILDDYLGQDCVIAGGAVFRLITGKRPPLHHVEESQQKNTDQEKPLGDIDVFCSVEKAQNIIARAHAKKWDVVAKNIPGRMLSPERGDKPVGIYDNSLRFRISKEGCTDIDLCVMHNSDVMQTVYDFNMGKTQFFFDGWSVMATPRAIAWYVTTIDVVFTAGMSFMAPAAEETALVRHMKKYKVQGPCISVGPELRKTVQTKPANVTDVVLSLLKYIDDSRYQIKLDGIKGSPEEISALEERVRDLVENHNETVGQKRTLDDMGNDEQFDPPPAKIRRVFSGLFNTN